MAAGYEDGSSGIDEGWVSGTQTGTLADAQGNEIPATGNRFRTRSCDVVTVESGHITRHNFYSDQMEFLGQLGLLSDAA